MDTTLFCAAIRSLAGSACCLIWIYCCLAAAADAAEQPSAANALLKTLDPFYKQHVVADGLLIVGSEEVSPYALREVATWLGRYSPIDPT